MKYIKNTKLEYDLFGLYLLNTICFNLNNHGQKVKNKTHTGYKNKINEHMFSFLHGENFIIMVSKESVRKYIPTYFFVINLPRFKTF